MPASLKYSDPSFLKKLLLGTNYRKEWSTPVKVPVFRFSKSGFKIIELGGGQQTKSLQLEDENGLSWVLRTVDKDVTLAMPKPLRGTFAQKAVQDMISAAHPHAPLVVAQLAKATNIIAPLPKLYFVADDEGLNPYKEFFANTFCFLEEREPTPDDSETKSTEDLLVNLFTANDHLIIQKKVLTARLLDMLIADWDRHEDQWRWGVRDSAGNKFYYTIPRDRDQAFFNSNGLLVSVARVFGMKHMVGFGYNTNKVKKLNYKAWSFDKIFLNELDAKDWENELMQFKKNLPDELISKAVKNMPPETYAINGLLLEQKLKSRRDDMMEDVMNYYRFISKIVTVNGTSEMEMFKIFNRDNKLVVLVTDSSGRNIYERIFEKEDTKQIILNGFEGNDRFIIEKETSSKIKLIMNGGEGQDVYDSNGTVRNKIIDLRSENNQIINSSRSRKKLTR